MEKSAITPYLRSLALGLAVPLFAVSQPGLGAGAPAAIRSADDLSYVNEIMSRAQIDAIRNYNNGKLPLQGNYRDDPRMFGMGIEDGMGGLTMTKCIVERDSFCNVALENERGELKFNPPEGVELESFVVYLAGGRDCAQTEALVKRLTRYLRADAYDLEHAMDRDRGVSKSECTSFTIYRTKKLARV